MNIVSLWRHQPGKFFCISTKSSSGKWRDEFFSRKELNEVDDYIKDHSDKDIYFCPHGFSKPIRRKEHAIAPTLLYGDLDEVDPRKLENKPTIAIESSPGRYVGLWLCDKPVTEQLNRRLTYAIGSDRGGWDFSQVLRVPGTTNYKYVSTPKVRLLWDTGPTYEVSFFDNKLPKESVHKAGDGLAVYRQYEKKLSAWARREILNGKPKQGSRSEVLWKLEHHLFDVGMTIDEAFAVVKISPWNKFAGRASEDEQIMRELEKILSERTATKVERVNGYKFFTHSIAEVEEQDMDWVWYPYLARGELTLLEGDPGGGKSWIAQMASAAICDGKRLPVFQRTMRRVVGKVCYFDKENDEARVTKKRLRWNGCKNPDNFFQEQQPFSVHDEEEMDHVHEALERIKPTLVVFDTINHYIGGIDVGKSNEVAQAMEPFTDIVRRYNCAGILIRHLTKGSAGQKALYRGQGNIAFSGTCRIQLSVGSDPDDDEVNALSMTKANNSAFPPVLMFRKYGSPTLREPDRCLFEWLDFRQGLSSDDVLERPKKNNARHDAIEFLREVLLDGAIEVTRIETMAEKRSIARRTLHRAAHELGIKRNLTGFGKEKVSTWELPRGY